MCGDARIRKPRSRRGLASDFRHDTGTSLQRLLRRHCRHGRQFFFLNRTRVKGGRKSSSVCLIISIGRLEATASADGDIGRSSQLDHSKELDLKYSELYWSGFLGSVQKNATFCACHPLERKKTQPIIVDTKDFDGEALADMPRRQSLDGRASMGIRPRRPKHRRHGPDSKVSITQPQRPGLGTNASVAISRRHGLGCTASRARTRLHSLDGTFIDPDVAPILTTV